MEAFLALTWKFIVGIIIAAAILIPLHFWIVDGIKIADKANQDAAVKAQTTFDIQQCADNTKPATESDSNEVQNLTNSLNACLGKLRDTAAASACVPVHNNTGKPKAAKGGVARPRSGLTQGSIDAANIFGRAQVDSLNSAKDWATACLANKTCQ